MHAATFEFAISFTLLTTERVRLLGYIAVCMKASPANRNRCPHLGHSDDADLRSRRMGRWVDRLLLQRLPLLLSQHLPLLPPRRQALLLSTLINQFLRRTTEAVTVQAFPAAALPSTLSFKYLHRRRRVAWQTSSYTRGRDHATLLQIHIAWQVAASC